MVPNKPTQVPQHEGHLVRYDGRSPLDETHNLNGLKSGLNKIMCVSPTQPIIVIKNEIMGYIFNQCS